MEYYTKFLNNLKNYTIYLQKIAKEQFHTDLYFGIRNFKRFLDIIYNNNTLRDKNLFGTVVVFNMFRAALDACYTDYLSMDMDNSEALLNFKRRDKQRIKFLQELYKSYLKARYLKSYYIIHEKEVMEILCEYNINNFATDTEIELLRENINHGYCNSFAVFGHVGSGTTYFAREIANKLDLDVMTFTLSTGTFYPDLKPIFEACENKKLIIIEGLETFTCFANDDLTKIYNSLSDLTSFGPEVYFNERTYYKNENCIIAFIIHPEYIHENFNFSTLMSRCTIFKYKSAFKRPLIKYQEEKEIFDNKNNKEEENNMIGTNFATRGCIEYLEEIINEYRGFTINEEKKIVTFINQNKNNKEVTVVKCHKDDDFDKYVGAALAYMYNKFGSKSAYRKWVDENSKVIAKKKVREDIKKPRPKKTPKKLVDEYMEAQIPEVKEVK